MSLEFLEMFVVAWFKFLSTAKGLEEKKGFSSQCLQHKMRLEFCGVDVSGVEPWPLFDLLLRAGSSASHSWTSSFLQGHTRASFENCWYTCTTPDCWYRNLLVFPSRIVDYEKKDVILTSLSFYSSRGKCGTWCSKQSPFVLVKARCKRYVDFFLVTLKPCT